MNLRLRLNSVEFDGVYVNLKFTQADGGLPSVNDQTICIQVPSGELEKWIQLRKNPETILRLKEV